MDVELSVNMSSPGMGWDPFWWMGENDYSFVYAHFFVGNPLTIIGNPLQGVFSFDDGQMIGWPSPLHRMRSHSKYLKAARILCKSRSVDENMSYGPWHWNSDFCQEACAWCSAVFPLAINTQHFLVHGADEDLHSQRRVRVVSGTGLEGWKTECPTRCCRKFMFQTLIKV